MLNRPSDQVTPCLYRLRFNPEWVQVRAWLEDSLTDLKQRLVTERDIDAIRRLQGSCQAIEALLDAQDSAPQSLHS